MSVAVGVALAAVAWAALFGLSRRGFWVRALAAGLAIGAYAAGPIRPVGRPGAPYVDRGGDRHRRRRGPVLGVLRRRPDAAPLAPGPGSEVDELYLVRSARTSDRMPVPVVLVLVGCAEELFWRGFVQARAGFVIALGCYAAVHLWERKAVLVLAAAVGGAFWGGLFAWRENLVAPLVSHALWDLAVLVWFPFSARRPAD